MVKAGTTVALLDCLAERIWWGWPRRPLLPSLPLLVERLDPESCWYSRCCCWPAWRIVKDWPPLRSNIFLCIKRYTTTHYTKKVQNWTGQHKQVQRSWVTRSRHATASGGGCHSLDGQKKRKRRKLSPKRWERLIDILLGFPPGHDMTDPSRVRGVAGRDVSAQPPPGFVRSSWAPCQFSSQKTKKRHTVL